jgi:hypothetical protein
MDPQPCLTCRSALVGADLGQKRPEGQGHRPDLVGPVAKSDLLFGGGLLDVCLGQNIAEGKSGALDEAVENLLERGRGGRRGIEWHGGLP